ncbi:MAG: Spy/CpxP family protein refolding chaperone [Alphaproteobacteria bacterium]|nr:Spy/CpxP family protein refolding chaperone [Alphaproteobacteria bacterium]
MTGWRTLTAAAALLLLAGSSSLAADTDGAAPAPGPGAGGGYGMMGGYGYGPMMGYGRGGPGYDRDFHGMGPWMMGGMWGAWGEDEDSAVEFVDGRLAFLKAELKITDKQMPEWNAFAAAVHANAKTINLRVRPFYAGGWAAKPLPERLDDQEKVLAARLEAFKRTSAAVKPLYAAFDEAQKKVADVILLGPMGGFHGGF